MNTAVRLAVLGLGAALIALLLGRINSPRPELAAASTSAVADRAERAAEAAPEAASDARAAGVPASTTEPRAVPADAVEFILGPQVPLGSQPWPWFDAMQVAGAEKWHRAFMRDERSASDYYDLGLAIYQLHARSGKPEHRAMARDIALKAWKSAPQHSAWTARPTAFGISPRSLPMASLLLLAIEGGSDVPTLKFYNRKDPSWSETYTLWDWLVGYARHHYDTWLGRRLDNPGLWAGVRDGGMLLHGIAMLAKAHPDPAVRAEFEDKALRAARDYYARLQHEDGSWRWNPGREADGTQHVNAAQPFMIGLLLEGMIAVHQLTGDARVRDAIVRGTEAIYRDMYDRSEVGHGLLPGVRVRGVYYFAYGDACDPARAAGRCGNNFDPAGGRGKAANKLKAIRIRNSLVIHAFGYSYRITGDDRFRQWGDDLFSATYGGSSGPGADGHTGLAGANKAKEYNQSFRSAGRFLGWRTRTP